MSETLCKALGGSLLPRCAHSVVVEYAALRDTIRDMSLTSYSGNPILPP